MSGSKFEILISRLLKLADQPEVLGLAIVAIALVLISSTSRKYRWWLMMVWAFFLPLAPFLDWKGNWTPPPFPISLLVEHGRQIAFFVLLAMLPAAIQSRKFNESIKIPPALAALFLVNFVYCARYLATEQAAIASLRLFTYCVVFIVLAASLPKRIGDRTDLSRYVVASAISALLVLGVSLVCYFVSPDSVVKQGRMAGLTSNPNFLGTLCGLSFPAYLGLILLPERSFLKKAFWTAAAAMVLIVIAWTGSRTAMAMAGIAVLVMFRKRLGRFLMVGVPLVVSVLILAVFFEDSKSGASRLTSLANTREAVWTKFLESWGKDVIFGNSDLGMKTVENSYLTVAANAGILGVLSVLLFTFMAARTCLTLLRLRSLDPTMEVFRDIALAGILVILPAAFFVGFLVSSLSTDAYWIFFYFIMAEVVQDFTLRNNLLSWHGLPQAQYSQFSATRHA